jgi:hypothetical protein
MSGVEGPLELGGAVTAYLREKGGGSKSEELQELVLQRIKDRMKLLEIKGGDYIFDGGIVYRFLPAERRDGYFAITIGFRKTNDLSFVKSLIDAATTETPICGLRISAKGEIDFERIKANARKRYREGFHETEEGNFMFTIRVSGNEIKVNGYPSTKVLSVEGSYNVFTMRTDDLIKEAFGAHPQSPFDRLRAFLHFQ